MPSSPYADEPEARIERAGRWTYRVYVQIGITQWGPNGYWWTVRGRRRAERKARKVLARYLRTLRAPEVVQVVSAREVDGA